MSWTFHCSDVVSTVAWSKWINRTDRHRNARVTAPPPGQKNRTPPRHVWWQPAVTLLEKNGWTAKCLRELFDDAGSRTRYTTIWSRKRKNRRHRSVKRRLIGSYKRNKWSSMLTLQVVLMISSLLYWKHISRCYITTVLTSWQVVHVKKYLCIIYNYKACQYHYYTWALMIDIFYNTAQINKAHFELNFLVRSFKSQKSSYTYTVSQQMWRIYWL